MVTKLTVMIDDQFANGESLYCTPKTTIILYVNYTSIKKKSKSFLYRVLPWIFAVNTFTRLMRLQGEEETVVPLSSLHI